MTLEQSPQEIGAMAQLTTALGILDDDIGGNTSRYTGSARYRNGIDNTTRVQFYVVCYDFDRWSNSAYHLDDPVNGDEFKQTASRPFWD